MAALAPEVVVGFIEPVLARRAEDVHVERILERFGLVRDVGRNHQHFAGVEDDRFRRFGSDPEAQRECSGTMQPFFR